MTTESNPYQYSGIEDSPTHVGGVVTRQLRWMLTMLIGYYVLSCVTLPLADKFWLGELPVFAIPQLPKSWLFNVVRSQLIDLSHALGIGKNSRSPDLIAMTPWSFAIVFLAPTVLAVLTTVTCRRLKKCWPWVWRLIAIATLDALVTVWFDQTSRLSIF